MPATTNLSTSGARRFSTRRPAFARAGHRYARPRPPVYESGPQRMEQAVGAAHESGLSSKKLARRLDGARFAAARRMRSSSWLPGPRMAWHKFGPAYTPAVPSRGQSEDRQGLRERRRFVPSRRCLRMKQLKSAQPEFVVTSRQMTPQPVNSVKRSFDTIWPVRRKLAGFLYSNSRLSSRSAAPPGQRHGTTAPEADGYDRRHCSHS